MTSMDKTRCHVIGHSTGQQCTGEPLDTSPEAEIKICTRHAGLVLELIGARIVRRPASHVVDDATYVTAEWGQ